ncbi:hypothetical protein F4814DRAFT_430175 [Daldinia grandis]|nr:hypothetical protein F4814DRAFT_430175 [Daldinia grandis]
MDPVGGTEMPTPCEKKDHGGADAPSYTLLFTVLCLLPILVIVVATYFRARETTVHSFLMNGFRMFAMGCGYIFIGLFIAPILCLHYVDKY